MRANRTKPEKSAATKGSPTNGKTGQKNLAKTAPAKKDAKAEKLSAIDAAAKVLGESRRPMHCPEIRFNRSWCNGPATFRLTFVQINRHVWLDKSEPQSRWTITRGRGAILRDNISTYLKINIYTMRLSP
jgi:hypothetical protein